MPALMLCNPWMFASPLEHSLLESVCYIKCLDELCFGTGVVPA